MKTILFALSLSFISITTTAHQTNVNTTTSQHLNTSTYFTAEPISEAVFKRMQGKSYKANCTIPRTELRYIRVLHYGFDGKVKSGELVCHQDIADDLIEIFQELYKAHSPSNAYNSSTTITQTMNNRCFIITPHASTTDA